MDAKTANVLVLMTIILIIIASVLLYGHIRNQQDEFAWDYYKKFLRPKYERGLSLSISDERLGELWKEALSSVVDPTIVGGAPGAIFDRLIDQEVNHE